MQKEDVFPKLCEVREQLRNKYSTDRRVNICSDQVLLEIADKLPKTKNDMLHISGVGKTFVEKYGDEFMVVMNAYHKSNLSQAEMTEEVNKTLKKLENRLININRRNRLLYLGKIYNKYTYDLYSESNTNFADFLLGLGVKKEFKASDLMVGKKKSEKKGSIDKKLSTLLREVSKDLRETGQYDLYAAYPFVIGKMSDEDFSVRAPLALFPIIYEKKANDIIFKIDADRDILYNTNLILTHFKFSNINAELPNSVIEDKSELFEKLIKFYGEIGINIENTRGKFKPFKDYKKNEFPEYENGEFHIENVAVLGKFSLCSSALQRDFKAIIESEKINGNLNKLLVHEEDIDIYAEENKEEKDTPKVEKKEFSETNINYINDLNACQENALLSIENLDQLVIQGPPGTGKSQTITSIIADYVMKGHNVLMVSQKKAALDVIYSRLGNLSKYAVMINDVKDKESFYRQMRKIVSTSANNYPADVPEGGWDSIQKYFDFNEEEYNSTAKKIDSNLEKLDRVSKTIYNAKEKNAPIYEMYQENLNNYFLRDDIDQTEYKEKVGENVLSFDYKIIKKLREKFSKDSMIDTVLTYSNLLDETPWLKCMKSGLNYEDIKAIKEYADTVEDMQIELKSKKFLKKHFLKKKIRRYIKKYIIKPYFKNKVYLKTFTEKPAANLYSKVDNYDEFSAVSKVIEEFNENERAYLKVLFDLKPPVRVNLKEINEYLYDFIIYTKIQRFEKENYEVFHSLRHFDEITDEINSLMEEKQKLSKVKFDEDLKFEIYKYIKMSKKYQEMCRQIESKRKPSLYKFFNNYEFELMRGIKVWLLTPEIVSEIMPLDNGLFDLVIFDEASQLEVEKGVPVIQRAKKVVVAGDHKQLRPSSLGFGKFETDDEDEDDESAALEEESLLDLARFRYPETMLNFHYRSKYEELISFSNYAFYKGHLQISPNIEKLEKPPIEVIKVKDGRWVDQTNQQEAEKVVELLKEFFKNRKNDETIGVITFNSKQRDLILDLLDDECKKSTAFSAKLNKEFERKENGEDVGLFIKNIENVQGDERDEIIFSISYAKDKTGKVIRNYGWLNQMGGENRLNVAISRAKKKIIIVTSITSNELIVDDLKNDGPKFFRKYLEYCEAITNEDDYIAKDILDSLTIEEDDFKLPEDSFADDVYNTLVFNGFDVERYIGIGDYRLDFAIKKDGKYVLGVECDSRLYENNAFTRERDIHREKYFKTRGWNVIRIWTPLWWHDKNKIIEEIKKICD